MNRRKITALVLMLVVGLAAGDGASTITSGTQTTRPEAPGQGNDGPSRSRL